MLDGLFTRKWSLILGIFKDKQRVKKTHVFLKAIVEKMMIQEVKGHFMVRPKRINCGQAFVPEPQIGKRFFYRIGTNSEPRINNTVVNYEATLLISVRQFQYLICRMLGCNDVPGSGNSDKYDHHIEKNQQQFNLSFFSNLGLSQTMGGHQFYGVAVAANTTSYLNTKNLSRNQQKNPGNILIVFKNQNQNNEVCISIHPKFFDSEGEGRRNENLQISLQALFMDATMALNSNSPVYNVTPDNFLQLDYVVTSGQNKEKEYKDAVQKWNQVQSNVMRPTR